jgi:site-specific DNA-methyltransferase (adenine-specific)
MKELRDYLYYHEDGPPSIDIYCGDCLEVMPLLPKVDLVVTDPPYGHGKSIVSNNKSRGNLAVAKDYGDGEWNEFVPSKEVFGHILSHRNQIVFGGNYFSEYLKSSQCWIVWDKRGEDKYTNDFADCELAWTSFDSASRIFRFLWNGMIQQNMKDKEFKYHPTQKPIPVMKFCIQQADTQDENCVTILDPFLGSGTTLVACKELKRNGIGIEISEKYCEIAKKRLQNTIVPML